MKDILENTATNNYIKIIIINMKNNKKKNYSDIDDKIWSFGTPKRFIIIFNLNKFYVSVISNML